MLADEWYGTSANVGSAVRLGVGRPISKGVEPNRIRVTAWLDVKSLPTIDVLTWRYGEWLKIPLSQIGESDREIAWGGPVPLFAVKEFTVSSAGEQARLAAMAKGFSNVGSPDQPINVATIDFQASEANFPPSLPEALPPPNWNALRGAAAMAVWSVPAMGPWLDLLCASLSRVSDATIANRLGAMWWNEPPWRPIAKRKAENSALSLWRAIVESFLDARIRESWRPRDVFEEILDRALRLGAQHKDLDGLWEETRDVLEDSRRIEVPLGATNPLGLALQLVLLRPTPEKYVTWKDDLPSMPPVVWWTGATLSGLLAGYRDLEHRYRGLPEGRQLLALRTWELASPEASVVSRWPSRPDRNPEWRLEHGRIRFLWDGRVWAERLEGSRGRWFRAELVNENVERGAITVAQKFAPHVLTRRLRVKDARGPYGGKGDIRVDSRKRYVSIRGEVTFELPHDAVVEHEIHEDRFRAWLLSGAIAERLPEPPGMAYEAKPSVAAEPRVDADVEIPGLRIVQEFLTPQEEAELLSAIDSCSWLRDLSRRVQHYGWRYNYKARKVDPSAYLGPLPQWATSIAKRLVERGLVREIPDQVIVNEYVGKQGIGKHIDCLPCFRGAIVTISICESWEMTFHSPNGKKVSRVLPRRSAAVLDGEVRTKWTHEIPKRLKEPDGTTRRRRLSLTFRKVNRSVGPQKG